MSDKISRLLAIDASVARAAGGENAKYFTSKHCRDFLQAVLKICHRMVMTPEIKKEWDKHESRFAKKWRSTMIAKKKLEYRQQPETGFIQETRSLLWDVFDKLAETDKQREEMFKDLHLIEAALDTDKRIISLDDNTARKFFALGSDELDQLKDIVWVNPDNPEETAIEWLEKGAPAENDRMLGFWKKERDR
jgi:predicted nucleic acid-binding protein